MLGGVERGDDGGFDGGGAEGVGGGEDVEGDVAASAHADEFGVMDDGRPGVVGSLVFGGGAGFAEVFDEDVLDVGAGVGEGPGDVGVAADDDEGDAGRVKPSTLSGEGPSAWSAASYQMSGAVRPRCMSLERSGAPVAEWEAATTQLLEPARQPLHWWARRSA